MKNRNLNMKYWSKWDITGLYSHQKPSNMVNNGNLTIKHRELYYVIQNGVGILAQNGVGIYTNHMIMGI